MMNQPRTKLSNVFFAILACVFGFDFFEGILNWFLEVSHSYKRVRREKEGGGGEGMWRYLSSQK
jgi:hypothetical protein